jgi:hypothetical protein
MDREKYKQVVVREFEKLGGVPLISPEDWPPAKEKIEKMIKEVDKAHEVYTLENTPKKEK